MDTLTYKEDLDFLYTKLLSHPLFAVERNSLVQFQELYASLPDPQNCFASFIDSMSALTGFFNDGHTNIEVPYSTSDLCLNIPCHWCEEKLILSETYQDIKSGSQILAIEHTSIDDIIQKMANRIPHENIYLVKSRMIGYPYKNYHIFSEFNMNSLFGVKECYQVHFYFNGQELTRTLSLENYNGHIDFSDDDRFVFYEFDGNTAVLHLNACICNDKYISALDTLADLCQQRNVTTLILDLSENMGGSSAVIDEFIRHVDVDEFRRYEMVDFTEDIPKFITKRNEIIQNRKSSKLFPSKILCRVSHNTFSSARTFAVTLKDNGIATIIGDPTGGKPSSFGLPRKFTTPKHGIRFRVSTSLFLRPNSLLDNEISLFPDANTEST